MVRLGMRKTAIYLPADLKRQIEEAVADQGRTVVELMREALRALLAGSAPPRPRLPLFESGQPDLAERLDKALARFGRV